MPAFFHRAEEVVGSDGTVSQADLTSVNLETVLENPSYLYRPHYDEKEHAGLGMVKGGCPFADAYV